MRANVTEGDERAEAPKALPEATLADTTKFAEGQSLNPEGASFPCGEGREVGAKPTHRPILYIVS